MKPIFNSSSVLFRFCLSRFFSSIIAYFSALLFYVFLAPAEFENHIPLTVAYSFGFIVLTLIGRIFFWLRDRHLLLDKNEIGFRQEIPRLQRLFVGHAVIGALGWAMLATATFQNLGVFKSESIFVFMLLFSIGATSGPTYAFYRWVWTAFFFSLMAPPLIYALATNFEENFRFVLASSVGFLFLFRLWLSSSKYTATLLSDRESQKTQLEYFRSIIEAVPGLVTIFDKDLRYKLFNSRVLTYSGMQEKELLGHQVGVSETGDFEELVRSFASSPSVHFQTRKILPGPNGPCWFIITMRRLNIDSEIVVVSMDIDQHIKMEQSALEDRARAEASARLAAVGELAAGIAHEINNPLAVITSKAEQTIRKMKFLQQTDFIADLEKIQVTGFRIANIVKGLKHLSRNGDADPFVNWKLSEIIGDITAVFEAKLRNHDIKMEVNVPDHLYADCRPPQIGQVILNLVANAFDVLRSGSNNWIKVEGRENGEFVELRVSDSGPGIPPEVRAKLMTPFFTTKAAGVGTGLGLSISLRIANDHDGFLYLENDVQNTCFVLKIPKKHRTTKIA